MFTDLLVYQERQREDRRAALDQMTEDASEADLYAGISEDYAMVLKKAPPRGRLLTALRYTERRAECHAARSGWGITQGSVGNSSGQASICGPSFPGRPDLSSMVYIIDAIYEIDLEPEVEAWLLDLPYSHYQRVMRNVDDFLVTGGVPDGDHVKKLQDTDDIYELRVALDRTTWRISFWKPGGRVIILLTVFRKTREGVQRADVDRAIRAKKTCQADHDMTITHHFERNAYGRAQPVEDPPGQAPRGDR